MNEIVRFIPVDERDYKDNPALEISEKDGTFRVDAINVAGEAECTGECSTFTSALAYVVTVLAGTPHVEYTVEQSTKGVN